jgi:hypothetical protein
VCPGLPYGPVSFFKGSGTFDAPAANLTQMDIVRESHCSFTILKLTKNQSLHIFQNMEEKITV